MVDLQHQSKNVNFSNKPTTRPVKDGTVLPATCLSGELFFLTTASAGSNLYGCTSTNTWSLQGGLTAPGQVNGAVLSTNGSVPSWAVPGGDITGNPASTRVTGLQTRPVSDTAPQTGQVMLWDGLIWKPETLGGAPGTITIENNATVAGNRGVANFAPGFGLVTTVTDTGAKLNIQHEVDTALILSRGAHQSGETLLCTSSGADSAAYSCSMSPTLATYQSGMIVYWKPDVTAVAGPITLNIDQLGAVPLKLADGVSDPVEVRVEAGTIYPIWYDGTAFRFLASPAPVPSSSETAPPVCDATRRGRIWLTIGGEDVKDDVAVCAKDANNVYDWRPLY